MKIAGQVIGGAKTALLVLPRPEGDVAFKFKAVLDTSEFDLAHPQPKAPRKWTVKQGNHEDDKDPTFLEKFAAWRSLKMCWMFLKSIEDTQIEWDTIKMDQPSTWENWRQEFISAQFNPGEIAALENAFLECNTVTDGMLKEARERFLHSQEQEQSPAT